MNLIITKEGCAYKALANLYDWYDLTIPKYMEELKCDSCSGEAHCKVTLETLVEINELRKINLNQNQK